MMMTYKWEGINLNGQFFRPPIGSFNADTFNIESIGCGNIGNREYKEEIKHYSKD